MDRNATTTVQVQMVGRTILDCTLRKLPSSRKCYRVILIVPDSGIPIIEYHQASTSKKPKKSISFVEILFADKKHDTNEKFAFSIYTPDKTITFLAKDETTMNEWLTKIRECHVYLDSKRYEAIFEANLLDKGLANTMHIPGPYRLALCRESLDLIPLSTTTNTNTATTTSPPLLSVSTTRQRFDRQHPLLKATTIELVLRSIRRCGHTDCNFYLESGRHSQIGEGDLWMALNKKSTARQLHELLLATMKSTQDDPFHYKAPRSRSGSSSENAHRSQQSRSSSLVSLAASDTPASSATSTKSKTNSSTANNNNIDEDSGYLYMA